MHRIILRLMKIIKNYFINKDLDKRKNDRVRRYNKLVGIAKKCIWMMLNTEEARSQQKNADKVVKNNQSYVAWKLCNIYYADGTIGSIDLLMDYSLANVNQDMDMDGTRKVHSIIKLDYINKDNVLALGPSSERNILDLDRLNSIYRSLIIVAELKFGIAPKALRGF